MEPIFKIYHSDKNSKARTGCLQLPHGPVQTPVFMPVGTSATVKAMTKDWLDEIGFEIILANHQLLLANRPLDANTSDMCLPK